MSNWINNLKKGDLVFVHSQLGTSLKKVEKITPAGNVKVGGMIFNQYGEERKADIWTKCRISEATPETLKNFRDRLTINKAKKLMREAKELNVEQALQIIAILNENKEAK